jgi:hypothetical protein
MKNVQKLVGISALAAIAVTAFQLNTSPASAATKAEIACRIALESGSRAALQAYLRLYPRAGTACNATASTATTGDDGLSHLTGGGFTPAATVTVTVVRGGGDGHGHDHGHDHDGHDHDGHDHDGHGHDHDGHDHDGHDHDGHDRGDDHRHDDDHKKIVAE